MTALVEAIGYDAAQEVALAAQEANTSIREIVVARELLTAEAFDELVSPEHVTRLGTPHAKGR